MKYYCNFGHENPALVSLVSGNDMQYFWEQMAKDSWIEYCKRLQFSLIVFHEALDDSERAKARSLSWQKCLILAHPEILRYKQIIWIDADVIIRKGAPNITAGLSGSGLALTDAWKVFSRELHDHIYGIYLEECVRHQLPVLPNPTPERYYTHYGLPGGKHRVWQAGVMVLSPSIHASVFMDVYNLYEEKKEGSYTFNYEMRPLSYHLDSLNPQELDTRFNIIFSNLFLFQRPEEFYFWFRGGTLSRDQRISILRSALYHSWFLHLAGGRRFLEFCTDLTYSDLDWHL